MPVRGELLAQLGELQHRAQQCLSRRVERSRERFDLTVCRWPQPQAIFAPMAQRLDEVGERLPRSLAARAGTARGDLNLVAGRLRRDLIDQRIVRLAEQLGAAWKMAELAHPERPLSRGYVRVTSRDGTTLTHARDAREAQAADASLRRRRVDASVDDGTVAAPAVERKPPQTLHSPPSPACSIRQRNRPMLMPGSGRAARIHYLPGTFRLLSDGDHVVCAVTGARIPLHELNIGASSGRSPMSTPRPASRRSRRRPGR